MVCKPPADYAMHYAQRDDSLGGRSSIKRESHSNIPSPQLPCKRDISDDISRALRQACDIQHEEFALVVLDHEGRTRTFTSSSIAHCKSKIFSEALRHAFVRSTGLGRLQAAESGDGSYGHAVRDPCGRIALLTVHGGVEVKPEGRDAIAAGGTESLDHPGCRSGPLLERTRRAGTRPCTPTKKTPVKKDRAESSRKRTSSGRVKCRRNGASKSTDGGPQYINLLFGDEDEVRAYLLKRFTNIQQLGCKVLAKVWIKGREPKKQSRYPYKYGLGPPWWPSGIRHKEPDHISKEERMEVLITILLDRDTDLELLEASTANIDDYEINDKRRLLAEMFRVARRFKEFHHPDNHFGAQSTTPVVDEPKDLFDPQALDPQSTTPAAAQPNPSLDQRAKAEEDDECEEEKRSGERSETPPSSTNDGVGQAADFRVARREPPAEEAPNLNSAFANFNSLNGGHDCSSIALGSQTPRIKSESIHSPSSAHGSDASYHRPVPSYVERGIARRRDLQPMSAYAQSALLEVPDVVMAPQPSYLACPGRPLRQDDLGPSHGFQSDGMPQSLSEWQSPPHLSHQDYSCGPCDANTAGLLSLASIHGSHQASQMVDSSMVLRLGQPHTPQFAHAMDSGSIPSAAYFATPDENYYRQAAGLTHAASSLAEASHGLGFARGCE